MKTSLFFHYLGVKEADAAGVALAQAGYKFDIAHTSVLTRAQNTLKAILKGIKQEDLPVHKSWRLNERHYGGLTGLDKAATAAKYGEEQVSWKFVLLIIVKVAKKKKNQTKPILSLYVKSLQ